jgi:gamma-glutamyl phosphate reductase
MKIILNDVIGQYVKDGEVQDYTKEMLKGDIALLTIDNVNKLINYIKEIENQENDVYITPLITELNNNGINFIKKLDANEQI